MSQLQEKCIFFSDEIASYLYAYTNVCYSEQLKWLLNSSCKGNSIYFVSWNILIRFCLRCKCYHSNTENENDLLYVRFLNYSNSQLINSEFNVYAWTVIKAHNSVERKVCVCVCVYGFEKHADKTVGQNMNNDVSIIKISNLCHRFSTACRFNFSKIHEKSTYWIIDGHFIHVVCI